jgi:DNA polymerase-3 subunit epsilon
VPDLANAEFAVIDTETTGLLPGLDRVVSLAVVPVVHRRVQAGAARQVLVDPERPIPPEATAVHGIRDADVAGAPDLLAAVAALAHLLPGRVVAGHNLEFDLAFLDPTVVRPEHTLDTLALSRLLWRSPGTRHTLDAAAARVGVVPLDRHTALGDAMATAELLVALLPMAEARGWRTTEDIAAAALAQRRARARVRRSRARGRVRARVRARVRGRGRGRAIRGPGATTNRPGATTNRPGATTNRPGATTNRPGATTNRPGATTST